MVALRCHSLFVVRTVDPPHLSQACFMVCGEQKNMFVPQREFFPSVLFPRHTSGRSFVACSVGSRPHCLPHPLQLQPIFLSFPELFPVISLHFHLDVFIDVHVCTYRLRHTRSNLYCLVPGFVILSAFHPRG